MPFARCVKPAVWIKLLTNGVGGRQRIFRPIGGEYRHPVPHIQGLLWPQIISHLHGIVENSLEYFPWHFLAGFGQSAPVDRLCLRPKPAVPCVAKERSYVVIHAVVIAIGHQR